MFKQIICLQSCLRGKVIERFCQFLLIYDGQHDGDSQGGPEVERLDVRHDPAESIDAVFTVKSLELLIVPKFQSHAANEDKWES